MSGSFAGFSEEDIRNLNNKKSYEAQKLPEGTKIGLQEKKSTDRKQKATSMNKKILNEKIKDHVNESILESAKLSTKLNAGTETKENGADTPIVHQQEVKETPIIDTPIKDETSKQNTNQTDVPERKLDLAQFQERQKLIEEQNKKRKELLAKALAVRTKQTKEEAQKLEEIRREFKKLDCLLSGDVKILRQQIEEASLEYMEAEKRYFRIEKEFLNAKLLLHQKSERKGLLTEHLCAVIEKNEERKAEKLNELMNKLNLKTDFHDAEHTTNTVPNTADTIN